jgi:hypothetical protein
MTNCDKHEAKAVFCEECVKLAIVGYVEKYFGRDEAIKVIDRFDPLPEIPEQNGYN